MKKLTVILIFMVCITGYISPTHAAKSVTFIITQQQLDAIIEGLPNLGQLQAIKNIDGAPLNLGVGILPGRFAISFRTKKTATSRPDFYYIVLLPTLQNGKINCTIDRIWLKDKWLTRDDLSKPNPYLTSTNGDAYCTMFLTPFLAGYGPGAMVTQTTLGYTDLTIADSCDLALGSPPLSSVSICNHYY